jgi:hypothetical protein
MKTITAATTTLGEVNARQPRHGVIGHQERELPAGSEAGERLVAVAGAHDIKAGGIEKAAGGHQHIGMVIDQQAGARLGSILVCMPRAILVRRRHARGERRTVAVGS